MSGATATAMINKIQMIDTNTPVNDLAEQAPKPQYNHSPSDPNSFFLFRTLASPQPYLGKAQFEQSRLGYQSSRCQRPAEKLP